MAKKNTEKEFNFKLYAIIVFFAVAASLVAITYTTYVSRYIALHPDRVAVNYVDTILQTGDGYNAYKNTVVSKNSKYGDFIRKNYMNPIIFRDAGYGTATPTDALTGYNDDSFKGEKTKKDDGTLMGQLIDAMYPYYEELVSENGWDDYDLIFTSYLQKLTQVRKEIFGDDYISDEVMFTALEANVLSYGQKLTGTEDTFDENTGAQLTSKTEGVYQKLFGEDYKFTLSVNAVTELDLSVYLNSFNAETFADYGISADDIKAAQEIDVDVTLDDDECIFITVTVVKIGQSWYVDNTLTDTSALYNFYEIG